MKKTELKKQVKQLEEQLKVEREKSSTYKEVAHSLFNQLTALEKKMNDREALIHEVAMFEVHIR